MKTYTLPFTLDVEMRAYHNKSFPLGVLKAATPHYDIWLCNRLINCCFNGKVLNSSDQNLWIRNMGLTATRMIDLESLSRAELIDTNKEMIRQGHYIAGYYDEFFIKGKAPYKRYNFTHDYIIFGYDDDKQAFQSAAYLADGSYGYFDIEYEAYCDAIVIIGHTRYHSVVKDFLPAIDIDLIKDGLNNYLDSKCDEFCTNKEGYFGVEAYDKFADHVQSMEGRRLDIRASRFFAEHRTIMAKRFKKLYEMGVLHDENLYEQYTGEVCKYAQLTHSLFVKYNMTGDAKTLPRIAGMIRKANENEERIIRRVVENL